MICELCSIKILIDKHHIQSQSLDGCNKKWNKVRLCPNCHREVHSGKIVIEGRFLTTEGYKVIWHSNLQNSITEKEPEVYLIKDKF